MAAARMRESVIEALDLRPGLRLLELGSGPGRLAIEIKRRQPLVTIDALDADPTMIEQARRNAAEAVVEIAFHEADIARLPDRGPYDRVYSTLVFHHLLLHRKQEALTWVRRVLRPGGSFVVADFGRPRGVLQWVLSYAIQLLDGIENTATHRDGRFELALREAFGRVHSVAVWQTAFGTLEVFLCKP